MSRYLHCCRPGVVWVSILPVWQHAVAPCASKPLFHHSKHLRSVLLSVRQAAPWFSLHSAQNCAVYACFWRMYLAVLTHHKKARDDLSRQRLGVEPSDKARAYLQWRVPRSLEDRLPPFLQELEASAASLSIADVQISLTSLEEVCFAVVLRHLDALTLCSS